MNWIPIVCPLCNKKMIFNEVSSEKFPAKNRLDCPDNYCSSFFFNLKWQFIAMLFDVPERMNGIVSIDTEDFVVKIYTDGCLSQILFPITYEEIFTIDLIAKIKTYIIFS